LAGEGAPQFCPAAGVAQNFSADAPTEIFWDKVAPFPTQVTSGRDSTLGSVNLLDIEEPHGYI